MERVNTLSFSWGDHLTFGEGDGRLATLGALQRRMERWRDELDAAILYWRIIRAYIKGHCYAAKGYKHPFRDQEGGLGWSFFEVVPQFAHRMGMKAYLYVSFFDEGWPLPPKKIREVSYHNAMYFHHISWQSKFSRENPEYALTDLSGQRGQWGVLCLAYPEVRSHFLSRFMNLLQDTEFVAFLSVCALNRGQLTSQTSSVSMNLCGKTIWTATAEIYARRTLIYRHGGTYLASILPRFYLNCVRLLASLDCGWLGCAKGRCS